MSGPKPSELGKSQNQESPIMHSQAKKNTELGKLKFIGTELFTYLDNIVIFADILEEHEKKCNNLIQRF